MKKQPEIRPAETYVLDDEDVERLDDMTLTSVIRDAAALPDVEEFEREPEPEFDDFDLGFLVPEE